MDFVPMKMQPGSQKVRSDQLVIPSDQSYLPKVEKFVVRFCKKANLSEDQSDNMAIAITELVNNGIIHANKFSPDKKVTIKVAYYPDRIAVSVIDQGSGFDPAEISNPTDPANLWRQNGRGIFLVKNLIDEVEINPTAEGTTVVLTEYIPKN